MIHGKSCTVAIIFIIAAIVMNIMVDKGKVVDDFKKSLSPDQIEIYEKIMNERKSISIRGYLIGLILSISFVMGNYHYNKVEYKASICTAAAIMFITHYFYYILSPKSDWMLLHLRDCQKREWLELYRKMQYSYHFGFLIGILSVVVFSGSFKCE